MIKILEIKRSNNTDVIPIYPNPNPQPKNVYTIEESECRSLLCSKIKDQITPWLYARGKEWTLCYAMLVREGMNDVGI